MTILSDVKALGQQIWLDNLSRSLIQSGELAKMLQQGVCGVTSNPAIFQKAFCGRCTYLGKSPAPSNSKTSAPNNAMKRWPLPMCRPLAMCACPNSEASGGRAGFVSLEVSPELARAAGTVAEARRLHAAIQP